MQGRIQKWVTNSFCYNQPAVDISVEAERPLPPRMAIAGSQVVDSIPRRVLARVCFVSIEENKRKDKLATHEPAIIMAKRPSELEADVVRFQNNKEKWIAFVGLGSTDASMRFSPTLSRMTKTACSRLKAVKHMAEFIKAIDENGNKRYDFQYSNKRGHKTTIEGLSDKFNPEYWNYAKLISGVLRYGMPPQ